MKNTQWLLLTFLVTATSISFAKEYGLHFDDSGNIIKPDQEYYARGLDDEKDGFRKSAMKNFMKSAEYGNHLAVSLVGLYHMRDKKYVEALAWYKMVDTEKFENGVMIDEIISNLETILTPEEINKADELKSELLETYGSYATLAKREAWKRNLKFTGTHIKGYIPPFLKIQLNSGMVVTGNKLKKQVDDFIFNYEFNVPNGEVTLDEIEIIETEE
jgi:hypothetical protein